MRLLREQKGNLAKSALFNANIQEPRVRGGPAETTKSTEECSPRGPPLNNQPLLHPPHQPTLL
jgi:hypothetical protein